MHWEWSATEEMWRKWSSTEEIHQNYIQPEKYTESDLMIKTEKSGRKRLLIVRNQCNHYWYNMTIFVWLSHWKKTKSSE